MRPSGRSKVNLLPQKAADNFRTLTISLDSAQRIQQTWKKVVSRRKFMIEIFRQCEFARKFVIVIYSVFAENLYRSYES